MCHQGETVPLDNRSGVYVGAIVFGQYRPANDPRPVVLGPRLAAAYRDLPRTSPHRMRKMTALLGCLSQYVIDHALIQPEDRDYMMAVRQYIDGGYRT